MNEYRFEAYDRDGNYFITWYEFCDDDGAASAVARRAEYKNQFLRVDFQATGVTA